MLHEIREKIQGNFTFDDNGFGIVQKRISLSPGMRHTIVSVDFFNDAGFGWAQGASRGLQVYLTNYPVLVEENFWARGWTGGADALGGPYAGDDAVLFKYQAFVSSGGTYHEEEFPNDTLGANPTFTFYSNQLYLTAIQYRTDNQQAVEQFGASIYLALDSTEVDPVEYGMGVMGEFSEHLWAPLTRQGVGIANGEIRGGMPLWRLGGHRPQIMGLGIDVGVFYETFGGAEEMYDPATIRDIYVPFARAMGPGPDSAFGTAGVNVPDWYRNAVKDFPGLTVGALRPQFPPRLKADDGNIRMV